MKRDSFYVYAHKEKVPVPSRDNKANHIQLGPVQKTQAIKTLFENRGEG